MNTGFNFLKLEAGFDIGEYVVEYFPDDNYGWALFTGLVNTLKISIIGSILAVFFGISIGLASVSSNFLLSRISRTYVEIIRNIPLLLQLLFWYAILTEFSPPVKNAYEVIPNFFISNRGLYVPFFENAAYFYYLLLSIIFSSGLYVAVRTYTYRKTIETSLNYPFLQKIAYLCFSLPLIIWLSLAMNSHISLPIFKGFNFVGGHCFTPEFLALLLGLVIYTSVFIAEITRAGIESIDVGQWEAAASLNLSYLDTMIIVIIPQALRVMIPSLTSQILNLIKNSSLAVAIGYPDFVSISNTTMNQTGQAIECILLIMLVYLSLSLFTSFLMNWFNSKLYFEEGR